MSIELIIRFENDVSAKKVLQSLADDAVSLRSGEGFVLLKDAGLTGVREYDIGIKEIGRRELLVDLLFKSRVLYLALSTALAPHSFEIEDEANEKTTLKAIFKSFSV